MTDRTLLAGDDTPAHIPGYGPVPAGWARALVAGIPFCRGAGAEAGEADAGAAETGAAETASAGVWLRRLYTHPTDGALVGMDSTRRTFEAGLRRFLLAWDGTCRTPWCDAPTRHLDHVVEHAQGGPTSAANGQGLCVRCNHTKQLPGWRAETVRPTVPADYWRAHAVVTTTPTGHRYHSTAPPVLPGEHPPDEHPPDEHSVLERHLASLLAA